MRKRALFLTIALFGLCGLAAAQDSSNVRTVGSCPVVGAGGVSVSGNYAYVASGYNGLRIIDISDPAYPSEVGCFVTTGKAYNAAIAGDYAYIGAGSSGLWIINVSDPGNPIQTSRFEPWGYVHGVVVIEIYAYLTLTAKYPLTDNGLVIADVSDPANPTLAGYLLNIEGYAQDLTVSGDFAYMASDAEGLHIINISNKANPLLVGNYNTPGRAYDVAVSGSYAYVADGNSGLRIIDISAPASPIETGYYDTPGNACGVAVADSFAYVADGASGLQIIKVSDPNSPQRVGYFDTPQMANGVAVSGGYVYIADSTNLRIYQGYGPAGITNDQIQNSELLIQNLTLRVHGNAIEYTLPQNGRASLKIYNLTGQEVRNLIQENKQPGSYEVKWDGRNAGNRRVSSGVYLVRLQAGQQAATAKMVVVR